MLSIRTLDRTAGSSATILGLTPKKALAPPLSRDFGSSTEKSHNHGDIPSGRGRSAGRSERDINGFNRQCGTGTATIIARTHK